MVAAMADYLVDEKAYTKAEVMAESREVASAGHLAL
jgi:hypothetical protein